jgi:hypothetical protein
MSNEAEPKTFRKQRQPWRLLSCSATHRGKSRKPLSSFLRERRKIALAARIIETSGSTARGSGRRQASVSAVPGVVEHEESDMISEIQVHVIARQMFEKHGLEAIVQAAQNAQACENKGDTEEAKEWRHIEDAMKLMRGPHLS